ncbi:putative transcription factor WRKY family [Helianthus annuus]|nr:putative transcription factor WRKY family [Helianthus annuus]
MDGPPSLTLTLGRPDIQLSNTSHNKHAPPLGSMPMAILQLSDPLNDISYNNEQATSVGSVAMARLQLSVPLNDISYNNEQATSVGSVAMARLQLSEPLNDISYNNEQATSVGSVAMVRLQLSDQLTDTSYSYSNEQAPSMGYERGVSQSASDGFSYYAQPPSLTDVADREESYSVGPGPMEVDNNSASMSEIPEVHTRKTSAPTMKGQRGLDKRRKTEMKVIRASSITDDGYAWRKYGQKLILHNMFPRCYFRCAHKVTTGCQALKQVQQLEDDGSNKFHITYIGHHTCPNTSHLGA